MNYEKWPLNLTGAWLMLTFDIANAFYFDFNYIFIFFVLFSKVVMYCHCSCCFSIRFPFTRFYIVDVKSPIYWNLMRVQWNIRSDKKKKCTRTFNCIYVLISFYVSMQNDTCVCVCLYAFRIDGHLRDLFFSSLLSFSEMRSPSCHKERCRNEEFSFLVFIR